MNTNWERELSSPACVVRNTRRCNGHCRFKEMPNYVNLKILTHNKETAGGRNDMRLDVLLFITFI
jgi:hypothetical protein